MDAREARMSLTIAMLGKEAKQKKKRGYTAPPFKENSITCGLTRSRAPGRAGGGAHREGREKGPQGPADTSGALDGCVRPHAPGD